MLAKCKMHSRCGDLNIIHSFPSNSNEAKNIVWLSKHWKRVHLNNIGLWFRCVNYDLKWVGCHYDHAQVEDTNSGRLLPIFIQQKKKKRIYIYIYIDMTCISLLWEPRLESSILIIVTVGSQIVAQTQIE